MIVVWEVPVKNTFVSSERLLRNTVMSGLRHFESRPFDDSKLSSVLRQHRAQSEDLVTCPDAIADRVSLTPC